MTHITASTTQSNFRFRNDDGSESSATWKANAGTNITLNISEDNTFRLRIEVRETAGGSASVGGNFMWEYLLNGTGSWTSITDTSNVVRTRATGNLTHDEVTTEQLDGPSTFVAGRCSTTSGGFTAISLTAQDTEVELSAQIQLANVQDGDFIDFRIQGRDVYDSIPRMTIVEAAPVASGYSFGQIF